MLPACCEGHPRVSSSFTHQPGFTVLFKASYSLGPVQMPVAADSHLESGPDPPVLGGCASQPAPRLPARAWQAPFTALLSPLQYTLTHLESTPPPCSPTAAGGPRAPPRAVSLGASAARGDAGVGGAAAAPPSPRPALAPPPAPPARRPRCPACAPSATPVEGMGFKQALLNIQQGFQCAPYHPTGISIRSLKSKRDF